LCQTVECAKLLDVVGHDTCLSQRLTHLQVGLSEHVHKTLAHLHTLVTRL